MLKLKRALKLKLLIKLLILSPLIQICRTVEVREYYKWNYINFTWPSTLDYDYNVQKRSYIPENNIPSKIKIYKDRLFMAFGRYFIGTPVTLGYLYMDEMTENPLLTPFPNWQMNVNCDCSTLQNVNAFDIDRDGIMWILDGLRHNDITKCPAKIVLYNIEIDKVIKSYDFPDMNSKRIYLADVVTDKNYAFITDSSAIDPGIIVYSRNRNKSWKIRESSMFPDGSAVKFSIDNEEYSYFHGVKAITISPSSSNIKNRFLYYSPLSSYNIYKLNVNILTNEKTCGGNNWRQYVHIGGTKVEQSYDYGMNTNGDLYFCLVNRNSLAKWNTERSFKEAAILVKNNSLNWCSGFAFDNNFKDVYILTNSFGNYLIANTKPQANKDYKFRILKLITKNKNNKKFKNFK